MMRFANRGNFIRRAGSMIAAAVICGSASFVAFAANRRRNAKLKGERRPAGCIGMTARLCASLARVRHCKEEVKMRNRAVAIAALATVMGATLAAHAQGVTVGAAPSTEMVVTQPVEVDPNGRIVDEQLPGFREYVVTERVPSYSVSQNIVVGAVLADEGVALYDVPQRFGATPYRYTVVNGETILIEPRTRRIMQVVD
jgi:hypothetical protein